MNKIRTIIFVTVLCLIYAKTARAWEPKSWMSNLPDSTYICSLTIPGTHDSCTHGVNGLLDGYAETQDLNLEGLFNAGVRAFDIRVSLDDDYEDSLAIYHGPVSCRISFAKVLSTFKELLTSNPKEFIFMIVKIEDNTIVSKFDEEGCRNKLRAKEEKFTNDNLYVQEFRPDLTLGEVRGKILVINRSDLKNTTPIVGAFANGFPSDPGWATLSIEKRGGPKVCRMYVQDVDHYDDSSQWRNKTNAFEETAEAYFAEPEYFTWCINHTSGWVGLSEASMDYNQNSDKVNNYVANTYIPSLKKQREKGSWRGLGVVPMDFAGIHHYGFHDVYGDDLVKALINFNFVERLDPFNEY